LNSYDRLKSADFKSAVSTDSTTQAHLDAKTKISENCDFGKFMRICQLQNILISIFITSFLLSCSTSKIADKHDERLITASWLKIPLRFALRDQDDNYLTHPFFDIDPRFKREQRTLNYFITTPEDSSFKYNFDLYSGKLYKERDYCPVDDIWDSYKGDVYKPNFTQGIVPRTYDQNSNPQRIVIFSNAREIEKFKYLPTNYDSAKVVGSVILDACETYPCDLKSKWTPTQILLAVNPHDPSFTKVNFLNELKHAVDWTYVKSILVNQDGVHQIGKKYYPAFRISKEFNLDDTIKYFETNSTVAKMDELVKWREGCFKLYDSVWEKSEKIRGEKNDQQAKFLNFFKEFYAKNSAQFYSCQKLVRPANINDDARRLWFFTYLQAFTNLEKNGFYFSCSEKSWLYNPKVDDTHFYNDQNKELARCRSRNFEKSFDQAINGLSLMKNQINKNFRFIEYDTQRGGSHQKLYSWVADSAKVSICKNHKDAIKENQFDLFPQDVVWPSFTPDDDKTIQ
jgi:hypothetical protein